MDNYVLVSVSDKSNILPFILFLFNKGYSILSTGGTYRHIFNNLKEVRAKLVQVADFTGFPEMLGGRVKTLHPKIYGGLLWDEKFDCTGITKIDMIIVNLYPFQKVINDTNAMDANAMDANAMDANAIENIDIGGVSLIRAAAKNFKNVKLVVDPIDYDYMIQNWEECGSQLSRRRFAIKGFDMVTKYDACITNYFNKDIIYRRYEKEQDLKYGCNPYQDNAAIYKMDNNSMPFNIVNGNPGYINLLDAINSWLLVSELERITNKISASSFKHTSPAGVAISNGKITEQEKKLFDIQNYDLTKSFSGEAFIKARNCDPLSSFGDFISISGVVDETCARLIAREVSDGIIAGGYSPIALEILKKKKGGKYIILEGNRGFDYQNIEFRELLGMGLSQKSNNEMLNDDDFTNIVTSNNILTEQVKEDMILATITLKYTPSNSIVISYNGMILGVGAGQQNRVDCIKLAGRKSNVWRLRRHPRVFDLYSKLRDGLKRHEKINAITKFIDGDFTESELQVWKELFIEEISPLTDEEKTDYLSYDTNISLSSDAFMPFRDNVDAAVKFQVKNIIQPGGSIGDPSVIDACNEYNIMMVLSGKRFFLH